MNSDDLFKNEADYEYEALLKPLTPQVFYILLALVNEPRHGYGIRERIRADSGGSVILADGTLYPALKRLAKRDWIEEAGREPTGPSQQDRLHYQLTSTGRTYLTSEICRLKRAIDIAERRPKSRGTPEYLPLAHLVAAPGPHILG